MDDHIAEVNQDPAAGGVALEARRLEAVLFVRGLGHTVRQGVELAFAAARADDEVIGERALALQVEQDDVLGFFVFEGFDEGTSKFYRLQS